MNLNKIQLIGRVAKAPEAKQTTSGISVVKFSLATNYSYKDKSGAKHETTQFHNLASFGKLAEIIGQYVEKGQEIYVDGRVEYRQWDKQDGTKGYMTEIMVENLQMGQKAKNSQGQESQQSKVEEGETLETGEEEINTKDIPF